MFQWQRLGRIFNPQDFHNRPWWMNEFAQAPSVLLYDQFIRVYFSCRPLPDANGQYVSYTGYVDFDRNNPFHVVNLCKEPVLEIGGFGTFDEFGTYPFSAIRRNNRIYAYYGGWTRCESVPFNVAIGCALSDNDGESFQKMGSGPILSYSLDEPFILSGPKIRIFGNTWYMFYIAGRKWTRVDNKPEPIYKIRAASSLDGIKWNKFNVDLIPDKLGENEAQASPDVIYYRGRYHMFFCYRQDSNFRNNRDRSYRIGYAISDDLYHWTRDDLQVGIDVSDTGWDSEMLAYPHVFELDGNIYMFYLGNGVGRFGFGGARLNNFIE